MGKVQKLWITNWCTAASKPTPRLDLSCDPSSTNTAGLVWEFTAAAALRAGDAISAAIAAIDRDIVVSAPDYGQVSYFRGGEARTFACAPRCERIGDDDPQAANP